MRFISNSAKDTCRFAAEIAKKLKGGEVIGLIGELGAGKTAFTKAAARELGVKKNITSPTFVLMKVYKTGKPDSEIKNLVHIDAYRLKTAADLEAIGASEYFGRADTVVIIEWADRIKEIWPKKMVRISILTDGKRRKITVLTKLNFFANIKN
jgi:tRNA threonylcarbamoyladenosine biosynthesis protein TsaE